MTYRTVVTGLLGSMLLVAPAIAQGNGGHLPNAAPLQGMQRARSYSLLNRSNQTIVAAHAQMTNGDVRDLNWNQPVPPQQARDVVVPSNDCLASLTVDLKSGSKLRSTGTPDCRATHITVTDNAINIGTNGTP